MSDEEEQRKREERDAWLGDPTEHGGDYRAPKTGWVSDLGCCGIELLGSFAIIGFMSASIWNLVQ